MTKIIRQVTRHGAMILGVLLMLLSVTSHALPFIIKTKKGTRLPVVHYRNSTVTAYYTVCNNTGLQRNNSYVKYLPPAVSQVTDDATYPDTCGKQINLAAKGRPNSCCTLQVAISDRVDALAPNPSDHLWVCFQRGQTCAGTTEPLNLTSSEETSPTTTASLTEPLDGATNVSVGTPIVVTFTNPIDPSTVTSSSFFVGTTAGASTIPGIITFSDAKTVATFTPIDLPLNETVIYVTLTSDIVNVYNTPITAASFSFTTQNNYLIFITADQYTGDLRKAGGGATGVEGADNICTADASCPVGSKCKALLGALTRTKEYNWVLETDTYYMNTSLATVFSTKQDRVINFDLTNQISTLGGDAWTGLDQYFNLFPYALRCGDWEKEKTLEGANGNTVSETPSLIESKVSPCDNERYLYCVQQLK